MNKNLPQSVEEMQDIIDIAGLVRSSLPDLIHTILIVFLVLIVLVGLIFLVLKIIKKRKEAGIFLSPGQKALQALEKLKKSGCISRKDWSHFYFSLDEILRHYLHEAFHLDVLDKTFEELKASAQQMVQIHDGRFEKIILEFWQRAQFIKFAKQDSNEKLAIQDLAAISQFVKTTGQSHE